MSKRASLGHQLWQRLESKKCIGQSRHKAKLKAIEEGGKVEGIYSYKTYDAYKQSTKTFVKWLKSEFPEVKNINDIDKNVGVRYIKHREQVGCSAYTYSQDMAMLNKLLNLELTKSDCKVAERSMKGITKNRSDNGFRTETGALETIFKATGLRRNELYNLKKENLLIRDCKVTGVRVENGSKGGKSREIDVISKYQEALYKLVEGVQEGSKVVSYKIPKELQTHRLRAEFAQEKLLELKNLGRKDPFQDLTESMGHNRKSVLAFYGIKVKRIKK